MKRVAQILCIVNLLALPALATAESGWYFGIHYFDLNREDPRPFPTTAETAIDGLYVSSSHGSYEGFPQYNFSGKFAKLGYQLNRRFALETRYAISKPSDNGARTYTNVINQSTESPFNADIDSLWGVYGRINFLADKPLRPYLLGGYSSLKFVGEMASVFTEQLTAGSARSGIGQFPVNYHDDGFSYGAGVAIGVGERWEIELEYMNWYTNGAVLQTGADIEGFNAGINFKF